MNTKILYSRKWGGLLLKNEKSNIDYQSIKCKILVISGFTGQQ